MSEQIIVTSALPYANGPIHFGHIVGAYLPADIYVRFRRMCGDDVHYVCGTDEHGVAITLRAEQAGQSYEEYVDHWHSEIRRVMDQVAIEFDIFSGTSHHRNPHHRELSQEFFARIQDNGYLQKKTEEQFYSESLDRFLPDRMVMGTCYKCGYEEARGDECPNCGHYLDAKLLTNPVCTIDGSTPVLRESTHWYIQLDKIKDEWLQGWFDGKRDEWKTNVRHFVKGALGDLHERAITRDLPWGVPVPLPDTDGKVLYVWFDAPIGYLSISKQYWTDKGQPERFEQLWKSQDTKLYHFIGKDNITFHVVVFPSMLWGTRAGWVLPENVPANEFFNLEGKKFSTSSGWYIPEESVADFSTDQLRYALATMMPETADSDWSWREFQSRLNDDLADNFGNFVARTLRFAERFLEGNLPALGELQEQDRAILEEGKVAAAEMREHLMAFSFRKAAQRLMAYGNSCNKYYDQEQPWVTRKSDLDRCGQTLRVCAELIRSFALLATPIMPNTAQTVLTALGLQGPWSWQDAGGVGLAEGPLRVEPMPVLFAKVDDKRIEAELAKLQEAAQTNQADNKVTETSDSDQQHEAIEAAVEFDQFAGVDMRAATVLSAEKHPKADKLLVLQVDLGFEQRTIVAGVAKSYAPEDLPGKRVVVVANLQPRKLRGIESQGMILATDDSEGLPRFIAPGDTAPDGTRVS